MAQMNGVSMVPEKYRKTRFTASCWFHLAKNPKITFAEYQRESKDKICRENVFEDVKKSMELDRLWGRPEAVLLPGETELPTPRQPAPAPPPPPNRAMEVALAEGLARAGSQTPKSPLTIERRALAEDWIRENPKASWVQFQEHHTEKELDRAWFDAVHRRIKSQQEEEAATMATTTKKKEGRTKTGDAQRIREYLQKLPKQKLEEMTGKTYEKASGHRLKSPAQFYAEKKKLMDPAYAKARSKREPTSRARSSAPPEMVGNSIRILAEIPLEKYGKVEAKVLREIVLDVVKQIMGGDPKVVLLAEPPTLEIRQ